MPRTQVKVTERLREQWTYQKADMQEDRLEYAHDAEQVKIIDFDIAVLDRLLSLPLGTKFNGMDIQEQMLAEGKS